MGNCQWVSRASPISRSSLLGFDGTVVDIPTTRSNRGVRQRAIFTHPDDPINSPFFPQPIAISGLMVASHTVREKNQLPSTPRKIVSTSWGYHFSAKLGKC